MTPQGAANIAVCAACERRGQCRLMAQPGVWCPRWGAHPDGALAASPHSAAAALADMARERLAACRACPLWSETGGIGRCASVRCNCAQRRHWLPSERCPEGRW